MWILYILLGMLIGAAGNEFFEKYKNRCKHRDWKFLKEVSVYSEGDNESNSYPIRRHQVYQCPHCFDTKKVTT